jgi:hypothetical protein
MNKEQHLKQQIARSVSFYLGGRGGADKIIAPNLSELGVTLTGGIAAGTVSPIVTTMGWKS